MLLHDISETMNLTRRLRVALVVPTLAVGGAEHHVVKLATSLVMDERIEPLIVVLCSSGRYEVVSSLPRGITVVEGPYPKHRVGTIRWLASVFRSFEVDVAHSFLWTADLCAAAAGAMMRQPAIICSERGDRSLGRRWWAAAAERLLTFRVADRFCANSAFGGRLLAELGCPVSKIEVIPNGVDLALIDNTPVAPLRRDLGWPEDVFVVGVCANLHWYKGIDVVLRAFAGLSSPDAVRCVLVGDGSERERLVALAHELGVASRVAFLGRCVPSLSKVKAFDVAISATTRDSEHCPNAVLEAMSCRKAVIATSVGGTPELITSGVDGLIIPPSDPHALAFAIERLRNDDVKRVAMAEAARRRIEAHFMMSDIAERFVQLWVKAAC